MNFKQLSIFELLETEKPKFIIDKPIRLIELFGGIGAQSMALDDLGVEYEHYKLVEFDKFPIQSYNAIHGTNFEPTDIKNVHGKDLQIVDTDKYCYIVTYSFPCQSLSVAGRMEGMLKGSGTRSALLWEVERLIVECGYELPQILLMENVPQVHAQKNMEVFQTWLNFLESKGYSNYWQDLNAKDYGTAQNRNRTFCISILGNYKYEFPEPIELNTTMKDYLQPSSEIDERFYIKTPKAQELINDLVESGRLKETYTR